MRPYPTYKSSGIEWVGDIPEEWSQARLKRIAKVVNGSTPKSVIDEYWDGDITWITPDDIGKLAGKFISDSKKRITKQGLESCGTTLVPKCSIILSTRAPIGHLGIAMVELCTNQGCKSVIPTNADSTYLYYSLFVAKEDLKSFGQGSTFMELSSTNLADFLLPVPPLPEQQAIATYLDDKTRKIDTLIEKKQRLIELLKEQRTAMINQAVSKGINPNVKMKDSGIEWLGEIPEHWKLKKIKYVLQPKRGSLKTGPFGSQLKASELVDKGYKVYNQRSVLDNDFQRGDGYISEHKFKELREFEILPNDVLITTRGTIGRCAVFPEGSERGVLHPCLIRIQFNQDVVSNEYISLFIQESESFKENVLYNSNATTIEVIYGDTLKEVKFPLPDLNEQKQILTVVWEYQIRLANSISLAEREIELLKEYRTALISEAVTGKFDVRNSVIGKNN
jgi:type I restriction enzyme S subunit